MKPGTDSPEAGSVVTKTTTTRILPVGNEKPIQFWDYLAELTPQDWSRHILYMYRTEPSGPGGQSVPLGKFVDASIIPWSEQEEAELAIMQRFGGRMFRVIVKRGSERVCEGKIYIDAPPRTVAPQPEAVTPQNTAGFPMSEASSTAMVADRAITTIAGYERQGAQIGMEALNTAANVLARFSGPQTAPVEDELTRQMKAVMIQRMMQPPPDPLELLTKVLSLQSQLSGGTSAVNPLDNFLKMAEMLKTFGVNIGQSSTPAVSASAELMRQLPQVGSYVVQAMTAWAHGREAERDIVAMTTRNGGAQPAAAPIPARVQPTLPAAPIPPLPPIPASNPTNGGAITMPSLEFVESKIVELFNAPLSAEDAADEVLGFLQVMDGPTGNLVPQLVGAGEAGLLQLFQARPILRPATTNPARLTEFIRAFLKFAGENAGEGQFPATKPN